jgi:hypothetical protein
MHKRWSFFLGAALIALPSFAAQSLWITPAAPSTTDTFNLRMFVPGCVTGLPVVTSSDLPPRIDVLLQAGVCPILPGYPPIEGPTEWSWSSAPTAYFAWGPAVRLPGSSPSTVSRSPPVMNRTN